MEYEDIVQVICGKNWRSESEESKHGGYGVSMTIAFLKGATPDLANLSSHIKTPASELVKPFSRLLRGDVFNSNTKKDLELIGVGINTTLLYDTKYWNKEKSYACAWGYIAAIAAGIVDRV